VGSGSVEVPTVAETKGVDEPAAKTTLSEYQSPKIGVDEPADE